MTLDHQQRCAASCLHGQRNAYLTGSAGTGKTTVILHFLGAAFESVHVTASTGVAAINLRDKFFAITRGLTLPVSTIYRWAGIALGPKEGQSNEDYFKYLMNEPTRSQWAAWRRLSNPETRTLVIDEISMLPGRIIEYLDFHFRRLRDPNRPFGGLRMIAVGDFLQLPPVSRNGVYDWAFGCAAWQAADFRPLVLTNIHRQNDEVFTGLLNSAREGLINGRHSAILNRRVARFPKSSILRLFTHNAQVDKWNAYQLGTIEAEEVEIRARLTGDEFANRQLINAVLAPVVLKLKKGARVMIVANIVEEGELIAVNGSLGTVRGWHCPDFSNERSVEVELDDGHTITVGDQAWYLDPQDKASPSMTQVPLRLAWASTIHKAQGLTLESALVDLRATREPGQAYVALSRVRTLGGLHLKDIFKRLFVSREAIAFQRNLPALPDIEEAPQLV